MEDENIALASARANKRMLEVMFEEKRKTLTPPSSPPPPIQDEVLPATVSAWGRAMYDEELEEKKKDIEDENPNNHGIGTINADNGADTTGTNEGDYLAQHGNEEDFDTLGGTTTSSDEGVFLLYEEPPTISSTPAKNTLDHFINRPGKKAGAPDILHESNHEQVEEHHVEEEHVTDYDEPSDDDETDDDDDDDDNDDDPLSDDDLHSVGDYIDDDDLDGEQEDYPVFVLFEESIHDFTRDIREIVILEEHENSIMEETEDEDSSEEDHRESARGFGVEREVQHDGLMHHSDENAMGYFPSLEGLVEHTMSGDISVTSEEKEDDFLDKPIDTEETQMDLGYAYDVDETSVEEPGEEMNGAFHSHYITDHEPFDDDDKMFGFQNDSQLPLSEGAEDDSIHGDSEDDEYMKAPVQEEFPPDDFDVAEDPESWDVAHGPMEEPFDDPHGSTEDLEPFYDVHGPAELFDAPPKNGENYTDDSSIEEIVDGLYNESGEMMIDSEDMEEEFDPPDFSAEPIESSENAEEITSSAPMVGHIFPDDDVTHEDIENVVTEAETESEIVSDVVTRNSTASKRNARNVMTRNTKRGGRGSVSRTNNPLQSPSTDSKTNSVAPVHDHLPSKSANNGSHTKSVVVGAVAVDGPAPFRSNSLQRLGSGRMSSSNASCSGSSTGSSTGSVVGAVAVDGPAPFRSNSLPRLEGSKPSPDDGRMMVGAVAVNGPAPFLSNSMQQLESDKSPPSSRSNSLRGLESNKLETSHSNSQRSLEGSKTSAPQQTISPSPATPNRGPNSLRELESSPALSEKVREFNRTPASRTRAAPGSLPNRRTRVPDNPRSLREGTSTSSQPPYTSNIENNIVEHAETPWLQHPDSSHAPDDNGESPIILPRGFMTQMSSNVTLPMDDNVSVFTSNSEVTLQIRNTRDSDMDTVVTAHSMATEAFNNTSAAIQRRSFDMTLDSPEEPPVQVTVPEPEPEEEDLEVPDPLAPEPVVLEPAVPVPATRRSMDPPSIGEQPPPTQERRRSLSASVNPVDNALIVDEQGHALSEEEIQAVWRDEGICPQCGLVRTHKKTRVGLFGMFRRMEPQTVDGESYRGYCLRCHDAHDLRRLLNNPNIPDNLRNLGSLNLAESSPLAEVGGDDRDTDEDADGILFLRWKGNKARTRKLQFCMGIVVLFATGVAVGIGVGLSSSSSQPLPLPTSAPSTMSPAPIPSSLQWLVVDQIVPDEDIESFGYNIEASYDGSRLAVASPFNDQLTGRVDVYDFQSGSDTFVRTGLAIIGDSIGDNAGMGLSVSGDGTTLAVGFPGNENGFVRVYRFLQSQWRPIGQTLIGPSVLSNFGQSVGLNRDGSQLVVGAPGFGFSSDSREGMARVYNLTSETGWILDTQLVGANPGDEIGYSVDMDFSGNSVIVGAPGDDEKWQDGGQLYWLMRFNGEWREFLSRNIHGSDNDYRFGTNTLLSGNGLVACGSVPDADTSKLKAGIIELFTFDGGNFETIAHGFPLEGEEDDQGFGNDIAISFEGTFLVTSSRNRDGITGAIRLYGMRLGVWAIGWDSFPLFPLGNNRTLYNRGPSVAISTAEMIRVAIGYESVALPNSKSGPLIHILQLESARVTDVPDGTRKLRENPYLRQDGR